MTQRIVLIDDHAIVRLGMRSVLENYPGFEVVGEAGGRKEALAMIEKTKPHLAIVDLVLGRDDGVAFVKECRALYKDLRILVITIQDESVYAERVIRAGADGFLAKDQAADKLLEAIDQIGSGDVFLSRASSSRILGRILREAKPSTENPISTLSDRELHVFQMIGTGMGTKDIAESLGLSRKTIETYREKIKIKLELDNAAELKEAATTWVNEGHFEI